MSVMLNCCTIILRSFIIIFTNSIILRFSVGPGNAFIWFLNKNGLCPMGKFVEVPH